MGDSLAISNSIWMLSGQVNESEPVREVSINATPFFVGRRPDLAFCIPCPTVSGQHAEILTEDDVISVRDMESTNGTFVNGKRVVDQQQLQEGDLLQFADKVFRVKRTSGDSGGRTVRGSGENCDRALALIQFDKLMSERAVVPFFQPIVRLPDMEVIGYEILGRSHLFGLKQPRAMFLAASQLNLEAELSRLFRREGVQAGSALPGPPHVFLNTHPVELKDLGLLDMSLQELRELHPEQPITLEIHESSVTAPETMRHLRAILTDLNMGLAYDDFGAGQARLIELVEVPPDYLKFDGNLIHNVHSASSQRQHMLASLVKMVNELGIAALAEGVESEEDSQACCEFGFEYGQGFFYGKPAPAGLYRKPKSLIPIDEVTAGDPSEPSESAEEPSADG